MRAGVGEKILLTLSVFLLLIRFFDLGNAPFVLDEPHMQLMLDEHFKNHTLPMVAMLGSKNIEYGPTALWFYGLIRLFTDDVTWIIVFHVTTFIAAVGLVYLVIRRSAGRESAAWTLALMSSSPYLFFYSRHVWDNTLLMICSASGLYFLSRMQIERSRATWNAIGLGVSLAFIFNLHLMGLPVLAVFSGFALAFAGRRIVWVAMGFGVVAAPYLLVLIPELAHRTAESPLTWSSWYQHSVQALHGLTRFMSFSGMDYFLDLDLPTWLVRNYGSSATRWLWLDPSPLVGWIVLASVIGWVALWRKNPPWIAQLAVLLMGTQVIYYGLVTPDLHHPHYFMPVWWCGFLLLGLLATRVRAPFSTVIRGFAVWLIFSNLLETSSIYAVLHHDHGTRGVHYGTGQSEALRAVKEICRRMPGSEARIANLDHRALTGSFFMSFQYLAAHAPECLGRTLMDANTPDFNGTSGRNITLRYRGAPPGTAQIEVE